MDVTWSVVLLADGVPVTGEVPCTDWDAASLIAPVAVGWMGGPVSVSSAVAGARTPEPVDEPTLFDEDVAA